MQLQTPVVPGYRVLERLGAGATGEVWRARREADQLVVALKVVHARDGDLGTALREAAVLSRVHHPHLLHLYDVLPLAGPDGRPTSLALSVQLASGGSLSQVLAARHHLTVGELITVVAPIAAALADLHRVGVVHGDVSPGNVLFLGDGMPMLGDVGVSRLVGEPVAVLHGTDGMVAPEVLEGFPPGPEADVYAVGALAWLCLTGESPGWVGTRPDLEDVAPHLDEATRDLVLAALAPEPEDRPEAEEVSTAVFGLGQPAPVEVAPHADPGLSLTRRLRAAAQADDEPLPAGPRGAGPPRHRGDAPGASGPRRWLPVVAGVAGVAALAAALFWSGVLPWGAGPADARDATPAEAPRPSAAPTGGPTTAAPPSGADETGEDPAPETGEVGSGGPEQPGPESVTQALLDARAQAWEDGDPAALEAALVVDSPAWRSDHDDLVRAGELGVDYDGVEFTVLEVRTVGGDQAWTDTSVGGEGLDITLEVETGGVQVSTPTGATQEGPGVTEVEVELRRVGDDWRLWSWGR